MPLNGEEHFYVDLDDPAVAAEIKIGLKRALLIGAAFGAALTLLVLAIIVALAQ